MFNTKLFNEAIASETKSKTPLSTLYSQKSLYSRFKYLNETSSFKIIEKNYPRILSGISALFEIENETLKLFAYKTNEVYSQKFDSNILFVKEFIPKNFFREEFESAVFVVTENCGYFYLCIQNSLEKQYKCDLQGTVTAMTIEYGNIYLGYSDGEVDCVKYDNADMCPKNITSSVISFFFPVFFPKKLEILKITAGKFFVLFSTTEKIFFYYKDKFFHEKSLNLNENSEIKEKILDIYIISEENQKLIFGLIYTNGDRNIFEINKYGKKIVENFLDFKSAPGNFNSLKVFTNKEENISNLCYVNIDGTLTFQTINEFQLKNHLASQAVENIEEVQLNDVIRDVKFVSENISKTGNEIKLRLRYVEVLTKTRLITLEVLRAPKIFKQVESKDIHMLMYYGEKENAINSLRLMSEDEYSAIRVPFAKYFYNFFYLELKNILDIRFARNYTQKEYESLEIIKNKFATLIERLNAISSEYVISKSEDMMTVNEIIKTLEYTISTINFIFLIQKYIPPFLENVGFYEILTDKKFKSDCLKEMMECANSKSILVQITLQCKEFFPLSDIYKEKGSQLLKSERIELLKDAVKFFKKTEGIEPAIIHEFNRKRYFEGAMSLIEASCATNLLQESLKCTCAVKMGLSRKRLELSYKIFDRLVKLRTFESCLCKKSCEMFEADSKRVKTSYLDRISSILEVKEVLEDDFFEEYLKEKFYNSAAKEEYDLLWKYYITSGRQAEALHVLAELVRIRNISFEEKLEYLKISNLNRNFCGDRRKSEQIFYDWKLAKIQAEMMRRRGMKTRDLLSANELYNDHCNRYKFDDLCLQIIDMADSVLPEILKAHYLNIADEENFYTIYRNFQFTGTAKNIDIVGNVLLGKLDENSNFDICKLLTEMNFPQSEILGFLESKITNITSQRQRIVIRDIIEKMSGIRFEKTL